MGFEDISGPDCCCGGGGACTLIVAAPGNCLGQVKTNFTVTDLSTGAVIITAANWAISGGTTVFTSPIPLGLPGSGNYRVTATYSTDGLQCTDYVFDSPHVEDFSITCPGSIGVNLVPTIVSFSKTILFNPSFPADECPAVANCSTIFGALTVTGDSPASGNTGKFAIGLPASIKIDGIRPGVPLTLFFAIPINYASVFGQPPCAVSGQTCLSLCGQATITIDPCDQNLRPCTYPFFVPVPLHVCP